MVLEKDGENQLDRSLEKNEVLQRVQEECKANSIGRILPRNRLLKQVIEGSGRKTVKKT